MEIIQWTFFPGATDSQTSKEQGKFEDLEHERQLIFFFLEVEHTQHAKQCEEEEIHGVTVYSVAPKSENLLMGTMNFLNEKF